MAGAKREVQEFPKSREDDTCRAGTSSIVDFGHSCRIRDYLGRWLVGRFTIFGVRRNWLLEIHFALTFHVSKWEPSQCVDWIIYIYFFFLFVKAKEYIWHETICYNIPSCVCRLINRILTQIILYLYHFIIINYGSISSLSYFFLYLFLFFSVMLNDSVVC